MYQTLPPISRTLATLSRIHGYAPDGLKRKATFHRAAKQWLKRLARELQLVQYDLRVNEGGVAVSGEVTLHSAHLYVQLSESSIGKSGICVLYRSCKGMKDYCGGQNHWCRMDELAKNERTAMRVMREMLRLIEDAQRDARCLKDGGAGGT